MFEALRARTLRLLRVPHDPTPPAGAPGSVRVFRAGKNLYRLRLLRWLLGQSGAIAGILFSLAFLARMEQGVEEARHDADTTPTAAAPRIPGETPPAAAPITTVKSPTGRQPRVHSAVVRMAQNWPSWIFPVLLFFEWVGIGLFLAQIPLTYAMVRLDYELRWYIVTDRSLRIRTGLTTVQESTMSFANVQHVVVTQGPVQRLLGIADVRVQSAGGGETHDPKAGESLHTGVFHGVDNPHEIRDVILARLRQFRETGLGDPDEPGLSPAVPRESFAPGEAPGAAAELLREARALRRAINS